MMRLHLLALLGLVMADTDPRDFGRLCSTGECPDNWRNVDGNCVLFMSGWEEERAREHCKQNQAEYQDFASSTGRSQHSLPVCLVRRETQCSCGRPNRGSKTGGLKVQKNEYPWQVRLTHHDDPTDIWRGCGGSIISRHHILTTASCTEGQHDHNITVWTREHDHTKIDGEVSHTVCSKRVHPEYNKTSYDLDIAVLHLCEPLIFSEAVSPICLPDPAQDYGSRSAIVTGWGLTTSSGKFPDIIQEVTVNTLTNSQCKSSNNFYVDRITDNMICAEPAGSRDACGGFSGSPLAVLGQDGSYSQIGMVSWGSGCAKQGYPGVYTRLTATAILPELFKLPSPPKYT